MQLSINQNALAKRGATTLIGQYSKLARSSQRLSTGLRVNAAADDAAGLAIRELQRADLAAFHQGTRNAKDAISMLQVADAALSIIDEKLIRMQELAEQAATGTYTSDQRQMIDSEFQAMADEINRIAQATEFNGIHLLDGSLSGTHDGSSTRPSGELKVHFGDRNDAAEDYYYIGIKDCSISGLGLGIPTVRLRTIRTTKTIEREVANKNVVNTISSIVQNGDTIQSTSGIVSFASIPTRTTQLRLHLYDRGANDSLELFTTDGKHLVGTEISGNEWKGKNGIFTEEDVTQKVLTESNGFAPNATYDSRQLNGTGSNLPYVPDPPYTPVTLEGMNFAYSGDGNAHNKFHEYLTLDEAKQDLLVLCVGNGAFDLTASWETMPIPSSMEPAYETVEVTTEEVIAEPCISKTAISIETQEAAQKALNRVTEAITTKDSIRAHLGALQNRLENTISNLTTIAENLQVSTSRISDVDVSTEMATFIRQQILTQSAVAMLAQANSLPQMALQVLGG